ncbi:MAG TPA: HEAT repeat domain-containing protein, partial [bacterium]|nr:HEAT repeat domain-containing protein [bacterium]
MDETKRYFPGTIDSLLKIITDEEKINDSIKRLSDTIKSIHDQDEVCPLIIEKIQPPMGIVTQTSPALLRPCLKLLSDKRFDIRSGIAYQSSVILSILQDPRSIDGILQAMDDFPLQFTKIRENLIYTLGNLKAPEAVSTLAQILESPDEIVSSKQGQPFQSHLLIEQKAEVLRSMGRIGLDSLSRLDSLIKYTDHYSDKLKTYLAWSLGNIGYEQKTSMGGVSADILIALLKLMKISSRQVFEEAVNALRKIDMPEFIHTLHLYDVGAVNILGLKPAKRGLYELSETIHYLIKTQKRAIIAVNGDSGTGKTYFCQSLLDGFGEIAANDILYLMRDRKKDQKIFNRILGLKWLKKYIEPSFYQEYPVSEEEDDPREYFQQFLHEHKNKKLIMLDGCRDGTYFQRVIELFYVHGALDIEVNFRATFSTRRTNLEEREVALESIKTHLAFLEEPILEDTKFYQEGKIILFDLDNS